MEIGKIRNVAGVFLLSTMLTANSADAQTFTSREDLRELADCHLAEDGKVTAAYLGALDSRIHGYSENLYEMTPSEREPYVQAAIEKNSTHPPQFIRAMFEGPYRQYASLRSEAERIEFLSRRLERFHRIEPEDLSYAAAHCD